MVEAVAQAKLPTKRQKLKHTVPDAPSNAGDSKTTMVLTNINAEEYKENPEEFEDLLPKRAVGAQVFIQFHDAENTAVGEQISVDSFSNKVELNGVLVEILREAGIEPTDSHID